MENKVKVRKFNINNQIVKINYESIDLSDNEPKFIELNISTSAIIFNETIDLINKEENKIIISLENVNYIDSHGLWDLFEICKALIKKEKALAIVNVCSEVKRVLDITGISSKIKIFKKDSIASDLCPFDIKGVPVEAIAHLEKSVKNIEGVGD